MRCISSTAAGRHHGAGRDYLHGDRIPWLGHVQRQETVDSGIAVPYNIDTRRLEREQCVGPGYVRYLPMWLSARGWRAVDEGGVLKRSNQGRAGG